MNNSASPTRTPRIRYSIDFVRGQIKAIDDAISRYTIREPFITYRSIDTAAFYDKLDKFESLIGSEYSDEAFMSTTPDLNSPALNKDLFMTIKLPKSVGVGAYINDYNSLGETEFLLARRLRFKITNAYKEKHYYYLEMELL